MGKCISLGEYNKQYKYIWIYLGLRFVYVFIFLNQLMFDQWKTKVLELPNGPFISSQLFYLLDIIIPIILIIINKFRKKKESNNKQTEEILIYNPKNIITEFGVERKDYFLFINLFLVVAIKDLFDETTEKFGFQPLSYWMFEMLYYELFHSRYFKTKIYRHHLCSIIFILSSCFILKTIYIILYVTQDTNAKNIFRGRMWIIPILIIIFFIYRVSRVFIMCNEKYYLEKKSIDLLRYIILYGIYGFVITSIGAIISSNIPCGDDTIPELSKKVCNYVENNKTYYFDSYKIYFTTLYNDQYFSSKVILLIIKSILYFSCTYSIYAIYQKLSPIYYICMQRFDYLVIIVLYFINQLVNDKIEGINITLNIINIFISIFYIFGSIVYLEFIELNFCNLNFYIRRNIQDRSDKEFIIALDDISVNSDINN